MVQAIIFDIDGTLIDSVTQHAKAWHDSLKHFGFNVSVEELRKKIGKGADKILPEIAPAFARERYKEFEAFRSTQFKQHYLKSVRGFDDVRALFDWLHDADIRTALGSSAKGDELSEYKRIAGIGDLNLLQATSDDVENSKPAPDIFNAVLHKLAMQPSVCVVVGDSPYDMQGAQQAGISSVALLSGGFSADELREAGAGRVYADIAALFQAARASGCAAFRPQTTGG